MALYHPHSCPPAPAGILSLDVSPLAVGWAWWGPQGRSSGVLDLKSISDLWVKRADLYSRWLSAKIAELKPDLLVIEQPFGGAANGAESIAIMHYLHRQTHVIGYRVCIHVRDVSRSSVVKSVLGWAMRPVDPLHRPRKGSGRVKMRGPTKCEVLQAINARHGSNITSDDEADAVAGLDMVLAEIAGSGLPATAAPQTTREPELAIGMPPARQQVHAAQAAIQIDDMKGPARRQLDKALAELGLGEQLLPKRPRPARGRRRSKS